MPMSAFDTGWSVVKDSEEGEPIERVEELWRDHTPIDFDYGWQIVNHRDGGMPSERGFSSPEEAYQAALQSGGLNRASWPETYEEVGWLNRGTDKGGFMGAARGHEYEDDWEMIRIWFPHGSTAATHPANMIPGSDRWNEETDGASSYDEYMDAALRRAREQGV